MFGYGMVQKNPILVGKFIKLVLMELLTGVKLNIQIQLLIGNQYLGKILMEMVTLVEI